MQFNTGSFNIFRIFDFVARNPQMPSSKVGNWKEYSTLINELVADIPSDKPGWYLWGRYNDIGWWETIYLGKAGNQKTSSLQQRLKDELLEERVAFWATVFGRETATKMQLKLYAGKYAESIPRSLRKCGTHFIIWVAGDELSEIDINTEEKILIDMYRPAINAQRIQYPSKSRITEDVIRLIDREIEAIKRM